MLKFVKKNKSLQINADSSFVSSFLDQSRRTIKNARNIWCEGNTAINKILSG